MGRAAVHLGQQNDRRGTCLEHGPHDHNNNVSGRRNINPFHPIGGKTFARWRALCVCADKQLSVTPSPLSLSLSVCVCVSLCVCVRVRVRVRVCLSLCVCCVVCVCVVNVQESSRSLCRKTVPKP